MPKISVIMPVYNSEKYLREAMDSILNQTFTDFEFIILDDGSTDSSPDIVTSYDDPRIRYLHGRQRVLRLPQSAKHLLRGGRRAQ